MRLGPHHSHVRWPGGGPARAPLPGDIAAAADEAGGDRTSVTDHLSRWRAVPDVRQIETSTGEIVPAVAAR